MSKRLPSHDGPECGFTLVELLVVMVIIGVLAGIAVPQFLTVRQRAYDVAIQNDLRIAAQQVEDHFEDNPNGYQQLDNPYFRSSSGVNWDGATDDVDISASNNPASTQTTYCLRGSHTSSPGTSWRFKRGVDTQPQRLSCNA